MPRKIGNEMNGPRKSSYSESVGGALVSVEVMGQMRTLKGIVKSFFSMDIMFKPAAKWPATESACYDTAKVVLSCVEHTACTVSCEGEVCALQPNRLAILRHPLEGLVTLLMLHRKLDFRSKSILREHDWEARTER